MRRVPFVLPGRPFHWLLAVMLAAILPSCGGGDEIITIRRPASGLDAPEAATTLAASLTGEQQAAPVATGATGAGTLTFDPNTLRITGSVNLDGITPTAAHIHAGEVGADGPVVVALAPTAPGVWSVPAGTTLTADQATALNDGGLYFDVHTTAHPDGEIRGQIGREVFNLVLTEGQEVPPTGSGASGTGVLVLDPATRAFSASISVEGMTTTAAHIHPGAVGANGPILFPMTESPPGSNVWVTAADAVLDEAQLAQLRSGGLYVNAHSAAFPGGEIRAQIARSVGLSELSGADEVPATASTATGTGTFVVDPATRAASGSLRVSGLDVTAAHVHAAAPGENGPIILSLVNTAPGVWSLPAGATLTADQWLAFRQGGLYYNAHSAAFPDGEIRGQISCAGCP